MIDSYCHLYSDRDLFYSRLTRIFFVYDAIFLTRIDWLIDSNLLLLYAHNQTISIGSAFAPSKPLKVTPFGAGVSSSSTLAMSSVQSVLAREILDSRGNPTVEVRWMYWYSPVLSYLPSPIYFLEQFGECKAKRFQNNFTFYIFHLIFFVWRVFFFSHFYF